MTAYLPLLCLTPFVVSSIALVWRLAQKDNPAW